MSHDETNGTDRRTFIQAGALATAAVLGASAGAEAQDAAKVLLPKRKLGRTGLEMSLLEMGTGALRERGVLDRLIRLSYGPLALGTLAIGAVEEVGPRVLREQFGSHIPPENLPGSERTLFQMSAAKPARRPSGPVAKPDAEPRPKPVRKTGWAKPKAKSSLPRGPAKAGSGSGPGGATRAGPGGPSRSSSPPRKSGARPKGPPKSGGPKRP